MSPSSQVCLWIGFETLSAENLRSQGKHQSPRADYGTAIRRLHDLGIMVNASFVFGMDEDDETVFDRTVGFVALAISAVYGMSIYFTNELLVVTIIVFLDLLGPVRFPGRSCGGGR